MVIFLTIGLAVALLPVHTKYVREFAAFGPAVIRSPMPLYHNKIT